MDRDDLYGLPLERFTEERNALARSLRLEGRCEDAAEVGRLRKPSLSAWAVNQLVRTQRREIDALFETGDALQKAQADVLSGRADPGSLREAADAERAALDRLGQKARGLLSADGHELTPAKLEQVSDTLHAAAIDEEARSRVSDGCLDRELRHVGLGPPGAASPSRPRKRAKDAGASKVRAARRAEAVARDQLERAERAVEAATKRRDRAAAELRKAEDAVAGARKLAEEAAREHERVRRALDEL